MLTVYRDRHEQTIISVKLSLRNIAKVKQADIEINGINSELTIVKLSN